jgi:hypothetical protein
MLSDAIFSILTEQEMAVLKKEFSNIKNNL